MNQRAGADFQAGFRTRSGAIAGELRRLILSGELPPGSHLRQNEFAERFGVSVTPVREAFASLAREGFVERLDHRGVVVFSPSAADLRENYEIRIELEALATRLAITRITDSDIDELERLLPELRKALKKDVTRYALDLSPQFHLRLYACAGRPRLLTLITELREAAASYLHLLAVHPPRSTGSLEAAQEDKEQLCKALRDGDAERAEATVREHLQRSLDLVLCAFTGPADRA